MNDLTLLLQTSNGVPLLGLARGSELAFDSALYPDLNGSRDYRNTLETGLTQIGASLSDIEKIYVDIGPGGLGVTRTGVAFANALGFALNRPTVGLPAFEILGQHIALIAPEAEQKITAIVRRAARPYVHFGLFEDGALSHYEHTTENLAVKMLQDYDISNIAGNVHLEGFAAPITNTAALSSMLHLALSKGMPAADARAYPIVEVLT